MDRGDVTVDEPMTQHHEFETQCIRLLDLIPFEYRQMTIAFARLHTVLALNHARQSINFEHDCALRAAQESCKRLG